MRSSCLQNQNQVSQIYTPTKRTNSTGIHTKTKNTDEDQYFLPDTYQRECIGPLRTKRIEYPSKKYRKGSWVRYFGICELENSPSVSYASPHIGCLSCTRVHITTISIERPLYQHVVFCRFWEQLKYLH